MQSLEMFKLLKSLRLVRLMRLLRVMKMGKLIETISDIFEINSKYIYVLDLVFIQAFAGHLLACMWFGISAPQPRGDASDEHVFTWVRAQGLESAEWPEQYLTAIYWAYATMSTA